MGYTFLISHLSLVCCAETKGLTLFGSSRSGLVAPAGSIGGRRLFSFACNGRWRTQWTLVVEVEVKDASSVHVVSINVRYKVNRIIQTRFARFAHGWPNFQSITF